MWNEKGGRSAPAVFDTKNNPRPRSATILITGERTKNTAQWRKKQPPDVPAGNISCKILCESKAVNRTFVTMKTVKAPCTIKHRIKYYQGCRTAAGVQEQASSDSLSGLSSKC